MKVFSFLVTCTAMTGCALFSTPANATMPIEQSDCSQGYDASAGVPPEKVAAAAGNVDMRTMQYAYSHVDLAIGGEKGMTLTRTLGRKKMPSLPVEYGPFGSLTHNWDFRIEENRVKVCGANVPAQYDFQVVVDLGARSHTFRSDYDPLPGDNFMGAANGGAAWLNFDYFINGDGYHVPSRYYYHTYDGAVAKFAQMEAGITRDVKRVETITEADGTLYTFFYDGSATPPSRLRAITSSRGYAIMLEYSPVGVNGAGLITKACALDLALTTMPALTSETVCPSGALTSTYSYTSGEMTSFTDQSGVQTLLGAKASAIYHPGDTTPFLTNSPDGLAVTSQTFADGRTYSYAWIVDTNTFGGQAGARLGATITDNQNKQFKIEYKVVKSPNTSDQTDYIPQGPSVVTDELNRATNYSYCINQALKCYLGPLTKATDPEGNFRLYVNDGRGNPIQTTRYPKAGSILSTIVETKEFGCSSTSACANKPTKVTDANGKSTDFTYDAAHGGVLTETAPADSSGVRAQKRYSYASRYAWISNGAGGYVQAAAPVIVLASEEFCRTSSADSSGNCAAGASDETVTTYEYGPDSGPNHLLLRGTAVTANGTTLRTCYGYDSLGRKISETKPSAGLAVCP